MSSASTICSDKFIVLFLSVFLPPPFLAFIGCVETVLLFNMQQTVRTGPMFLSLGQAPQIHGFQIFLMGVVFLSCIMYCAQNMVEKKQYFLEYFFLNNNLNFSVQNGSLHLYLFFKTSFCFVNFSENKSHICATRSLLRVLPPHLYTDAYVSIENTTDIQSIWLLFLYKK